jgi:murein DD-endopeptidase MepM/ murein hydrolase activator NlpD
MKRKLKIIGLIIYFISVCFTGYSNFASGAGIAELKKCAAEVRQKIQENKKNILDQVKFQKSTKKTKSDIESKINELNKKIFNLEQEIKYAKKRIAELESKTEESLEVLRKCINSVYKVKNPGMFEIVFQSRNFDDFLDKTELATFFGRKISLMVEQIDRNIEETEAIKAKNETRLSQIEESEKLLAHQRGELEKLIKNSEESQFQSEKELDENDEEFKKIENEISEYWKKVREEQKRRREQLAKQKQRQLKQEKNRQKLKEKTGQTFVSESSFAAGKSKFMWPVPGFDYISSGFTDTSNRKSRHGAIDIAGAGIYGAKVLACAGGEIITVNESGWGGGYGTFVAIAHKNLEDNNKENITTIYAHLSGILVKKGQKVEKGQHIAWVGNTGHSTGAHLHWEAQKDKIKFNPLSWVAS